MSGSKARGRRTPRSLQVILLALVAIGLAGYAFWGVQRDDLVLPSFGGHRGASKPALHFHGVWAMAVAATMACASVAALVQMVEVLRTPEGKRVRNNLSTLFSAVALLPFLVIITLRQFGAI